MTIQLDYMRDEWDLIVGAPALTALFLIEAEHCSADVAYRKLDTAIRAITWSVAAARTSQLIAAVQEAVRAGESPRWPSEYPRDLDDVGAWALDRCRRVAAILDQKASEPEARAYIQWLLQISQYVAMVPDDREQPGGRNERPTERLRAALEDLTGAFGTTHETTQC